ncbi:MAG: hypothetical protein Kow0010_13410 [Dehalococcoidia bacterium]
MDSPRASGPEQMIAAVRFGAPWVLLGMAFFATMSLIWWSLLDPGNTDRVEEIVVPPGTAERIRTGQPVDFLPATVELSGSRQLRVINRDDVAHSVAGQRVFPGETVTITAEGADGELICSFHPGGALAFSVEGRGSLIETVTVPTLILGLPVGLLLAVAIGVAKKIGTEDEPGAGAATNHA